MFTQPDLPFLHRNSLYKSGLPAITEHNTTYTPQRGHSPIPSALTPFDLSYVHYN